MAGRKIKGLASLQGHDFKKYMRNEPSAEVNRRLLGLFHVQDGKSCREAAEMVKVHENAVQAWVRRFDRGGLEALQRQPGQGASKKINSLDVTQIKEGILALQETRTGGRIRGKDVQKYLLEKWGIAYKKSAVYDFLKSINLVWISARSKHPAGDHVAQDAFKKTLLQTSKHASRQKQT